MEALRLAVEANGYSVTELPYCSSSGAFYDTTPKHYVFETFTSLVRFLAEKLDDPPDQENPVFESLLPVGYGPLSGCLLFGGAAAIKASAPRTIF